MLHIVNKSPNERTSLDSCLRLAQPGTPILLIEDGVYAALRGSTSGDKLQQGAASHRFFVLQADADARGVTDRLVDDITVVDYGGFVDLVAENPTNQSWL